MHTIMDTTNDDDGDLTLRCGDCGEGFAYSRGEQAFFSQRGFAPPKRCAVCRELRRQELRSKAGLDRLASRPAD
jgi:hypothetical protein